MPSNARLVKALRTLEGFVCKRTHYNECGTLILYLDSTSQPDRNLTLWRLYVDAAWRLEDDKGVIMGYADPDVDILLFLRRLWGSTIEKTELQEVSYDLV